MKTSPVPRLRRWCCYALPILLWFGLSNGAPVAEEQAVTPPDEFKFERAAKPPPAEGGPSFADQKLEDRRSRERYNLMQSIIMGITLVLSLITVSVFVTKTSDSAVHLVNACALTLIVFGTIYITILADTDQQLTASTGILGAVAGYLFGSMRRGEGGAGPTSPQRGG